MSAMDDLAVEMLAREIARQSAPTSILRTAFYSSPHEIARALFLLGWRPPHQSTGEGVEQ